MPYTELKSITDAKVVDPPFTPNFRHYSDRGCFELASSDPTKKGSGYTMIRIKETGNPAWPRLPTVFVNDPRWSSMPALHELDIWVYLFREVPERAHAMMNALILDRSKIVGIQTVNVFENAVLKARKALSADE